MKIKFDNYEFRVYPGVLSEDMPKAVWFWNVYDLEDDEIVCFGDPKQTKKEAVEEGKMIFAGLALPCDVGCCGANVDEPGDCDHCDIGKAWDEFEKKIKEEMEK